MLVTKPFAVTHCDTPLLLDAHMHGYHGNMLFHII